jgi:very-short-patch-repair endonuclease
VGRRPHIPQELTRRPFSLAEARDAGLSSSALKGKTWKRLGSELYCWSELRLDPWHVLSTWHRSLSSRAVFSGPTAAWMLGLDFEPTDPVNVVVPLDSGIRSRPGLISRRCELGTTESVVIRGLPATNLKRTLLDLCVLLPPVEALVAIDMSVQSGLVDVIELWRHGRVATGRPGSARLRELATMAEPAESPMETRLRWLLLQAELPRPQVQVDLRDSNGRFLGRADLYYRAERLILEFDGGNHRDRLVEDDRRQNLLIGSGHRILRFTTADLRSRPDLVIAQVRDALVTARLAPAGRKISA